VRRAAWAVLALALLGFVVRGATKPDDPFLLGVKDQRDPIAGFEEKEVVPHDLAARNAPVLPAPDDDGPRAPSGPRTADGHRVFNIKSVSAFLDEIDRLARCIQEGDLARAADAEPDSPIQLRLAARQLEYVSKELGKLLRTRGWNE